MGWNPSAFKGNMRLPVENMTWYDCLVFCNKRSEQETSNNSEHEKKAEKGLELSGLGLALIEINIQL